MAKDSRADTWKSFVAILGALSPKERDEWLNLFLTPAEKHDLVDRLLIMQHLAVPNPDPQRDLSKVLGVSISKITRGSNALKMLSNAKKQKLRDFLSQLKQT